MKNKKDPMAKSHYSMLLFRPCSCRQRARRVWQRDSAERISVDIFFAWDSKILIRLDLQGLDRGSWLQNLGIKGLTAKIFQNKDLARLQREWNGMAGSLLDGVDARRTFLLCAFLILGQGCSSQDGKFCCGGLWKRLRSLDTAWDVAGAPTLCKERKRMGEPCFKED